jgi:hypothetical protein
MLKTQKDYYVRLALPIAYYEYKFDLDDQGAELLEHDRYIRILSGVIAAKNLHERPTWGLTPVTDQQIEHALYEAKVGEQYHTREGLDTIIRWRFYDQSLLSSQGRGGKPSSRTPGLISEQGVALVALNRKTCKEEFRMAILQAEEFCERVAVDYKSLCLEAISPPPSSIEEYKLVKPEALSITLEKWHEYVAKVDCLNQVYQRNKAGWSFV